MSILCTRHLEDPHKYMKSSHSVLDYGRWRHHGWLLLELCNSLHHVKKNIYFMTNSYLAIEFMTGENVTKSVNFIVSIFTSGKVSLKFVPASHYITGVSFIGQPFVLSVSVLMTGQHVQIGRCLWLICWATLQYYHSEIKQHIALGYHTKPLLFALFLIHTIIIMKQYEIIRMTGKTVTLKINRLDTNSYKKKFKLWMELKYYELIW